MYCHCGTCRKVENSSGVCGLCRGSLVTGYRQRQGFGKYSMVKAIISLFTCLREVTMVWNTNVCISHSRALCIHGLKWPPWNGWCVRACVSCKTIELILNYCFSLGVAVFSFFAGERGWETASNYFWRLTLKDIGKLTFLWPVGNASALLVAVDTNPDRTDLELRVFLGLKAAPVNSHDWCYLSKLILMPLLACYFLSVLVQCHRTGSL